MKNLLKISALLAAIILIACSNEALDSFSEMNQEVAYRNVEIPFTVDYIGTYLYGPFGIPTDKCDINVFVEGEGTGTHVGHSMIHFDFCVTPYFTPDGQLDHGDYGNSDAYIVAANGDLLFVSVEGTVYPGRLDDHPEHVVSYWRDPFVITGGTGRFEGATGGGMTNDYNSSEDSNSHHHWEGTINLQVGN